MWTCRWPKCVPKVNSLADPPFAPLRLRAWNVRAHTVASGVFPSASKGKDIWDILDVVGKFVIPAAVAFVAYLWNVEATKRNTATQMIGRPT